MAAKDYSDDELNYFRVCRVITSIVPDRLRTVFKQEWNTHFQASYGTWQDTHGNGNDFFNLESPRNQKRNARLLSLMKNGNTLEWDCTCLFHALLFSDSVGVAVNPSVKAAINDLREFRNQTFAHTTDGKLTKLDFQASIQQVITSFTALKLDTIVIEEIKNETSFPTDELCDLKQELSKEKKRNEEPKPFCVLPPKPSHASFYRENEVKETMKEMQRLMNSNANEITVVYLSGNPGCGKSQIARQIGESFFSDVSAGSADVKFVTTLNASTDETLLQSYLELGERLGCNEESLTRFGTSKDLTTEVKLYNLRSLIDPRLQRYSSWLIIADNVTKLKSVSKYLPKPGDKTLGHGHILITTQDSQCISSDDHTYHLSLSTGMHPDDAIETLKCVSKIPDENETLLKVAEVLDFQPLALACAAVYMQRIRISDPSCGWTKYLKKLEEGKREATEKAYVKTSSSYPISMTQAVSMAVEREMDNEKVMMYTFQFLSAIAPEPIALEYVVSYVSQYMCDEDEDLLAANICSSSLIICSEEEPKEVRIHQVVRNYLQSIFNDKETVKKDTLLSTVLAFSNLAYINMDNATAFIKTRTLVLHFQALASKLELNSDSVTVKIVQSFGLKHDNLRTNLRTIVYICQEQAKFEAAYTYYELTLAIDESVHGKKHPKYTNTLNLLGNTLRNLGQYAEAKTCLERALAIDESVHGDKHPALASTLTNLGITLGDLGQYAEAKTCSERALAIDESVHGDKHPEFAMFLTNLGNTLINLGQYAEAKTCLERALAIDESVHGDKHPALASTLTNLGITLGDLGQYAEAKTCSERALAIDESVHGDKHPEFAMFLTNLGNTLINLGQYAEAKACLERALAIDESVHGDKHPGLAITLTNLGITLRGLGQYAEAKACLERALAIKESVHGDKHPGLAITLTNLGNTLHDFGQYAEAKACLERALAIDESVHGDKHPEFAITLTNLGITLGKLGQYAEVKACLERSLAIDESVHGDKHPALVITLTNLGNTLIDLGQYAEAKACLERALAIKESVLGDKHPALAIILTTLGITLSNLGQDAEAKACLERALAIDESVHGDKHPALASTLTNLGITLGDLGQYAEAKTCLERALAIDESVHGDKHPALASTLTNLGITLGDLGQYAEAKTCSERALAIDESVHGDKHPRLAITLTNLGITLSDLGQYAEAKACLERALAIKESVHGDKHPEFASTLTNLGIALSNLGQYAEAKTCLERALAIDESVLGDKHPALAIILTNLGNTLRDLGQYAEAKACLERARVIKESV